MKVRFKVAALTTIIAVVLNTPLALAKNNSEPSGAEPKEQKEANTPNLSRNPNFKDIDQQTAYVLGASFANYLIGVIDNNDKVGVVMNRKVVLDGFQDAFNGKSKVSEEEINLSLKALEDRSRAAVEKKMNEEDKRGKAFIEKFAKEKGVKKTESGLHYLIEKVGQGNFPTDKDVVVVNYKGTLIDGTEFDNTWTRQQPFTFSLNGVIDGWAEGIKLLKKGGKMKLVIPPEKAYGKRAVPGIPANSTLIFDIELLDINPETKATQNPTNSSQTKKVESAVKDNNQADKNAGKDKK